MNGLASGESESELPTRDDFITCGDLDQQYAYKQFGGRSLEWVRETVAENWLAHQENFMLMGIRAFCYYLPALVAYFDLREFDCQEVRMFCFDCEFRIEDFQGQPEFKQCASRVLDGIVRVSELFESDVQRVVDEYADTTEEVEGARRKLADARLAYEELLARM